MSLCDCRGLFANDKEVARRRSVSREPQALLACESLIQSKRADELISGSLSIMLIILMIIMPLIVELIKATKK